MHRIPVTTALLSETTPALPREALRHLRALRVRDGEMVELFDGVGTVRPFAWNAALGALTATGSSRQVPRPSSSIVLFACVTKGSRWDWTIEKAVELGVTRVVPVISERTVVRIPPAEHSAKAERWRRIAEDAARQSDAAWMPEILEPVDFPRSLELVRECGAVFVGALVNPPAPPLQRVVLDAMAKDASAGAPLGVFVGPEGDFTPRELASLLEIAHPASFGPTVLRAETAAIFAVSVVASIAAAAPVR